MQQRRTNSSTGGAPKLLSKSCFETAPSCVELIGASPGAITEGGNWLFGISTLEDAVKLATLPQQRFKEKREKMERNINFFLLAALCFHMLTGSSQVYSYDFLSIACGAAAGKTDDLGIDWVTDDGYIQTGKNLRGLDDTFPYDSLKYFPEGRSKNCFVLPANQTTTYLLRASFYPGNDTTGPSIDSPVDFNVTVNNDLLFGYFATAESRPSGFIESVVHTFDKKEIFFCLVKGTQGFPFINGIELRELEATAYAQVKKKKFLISIDRYNTGTKPDDTNSLRYPDDPFDRIWFPTPWTNFPAYQRVEYLSVTPHGPEAEEGYNWPPVKVLQDAWVGRNLSSPDFVKPDSLSQLYAAFYIDEIQNVTLSEANPLGILLGVNNFFYEFNVTESDNSLEVWITTDVSADPSVNFTILSQPWSKHPVVLNGFELLSMFDVDTSATFTTDQKALIAIKQSFGLEDWTGDACYPVEWDWVKCNTLSTRVNKLLLSDKNISGSIPKEISQMSDLTEIYLDNNELTGEIPQSIFSLSKLKVLNLANNDLSGSVPVSFQNKVGFTFSGNPRLCLTGNGSCAPPPGPPSPPNLPSPSTAAELILNEISQIVLFIVVITVTLVQIAWI
ncbi:hypothetical protein R1flu_017431 [Riccia fluitans]|uniref:Malectin-like domain-containing protein n=1 Tax=Riccia fluitans TaxID=41844 RepID=A0ABD1ZD20_9MARC